MSRFKKFYLLLNTFNSQIQLILSQAAANGQNNIWFGLINAYRESDELRFVRSGKIHDFSHFWDTLFINYDE